MTRIYAIANYPDRWSIAQDRQRVAGARLVLRGLWYDEGRWFAMWCPNSRSIQRTALDLLRHDLKPVLSRRCKHLKGHGGVKGTVRHLERIADRYTYVARFDVVSYYESVDHRLLLGLLDGAGIRGDLGITHFVGVPAIFNALRDHPKNLRADFSMLKMVLAGAEVVALQEGHVLLVQTILEHCQPRLARFKHPNHVVFIDELPRNATGKVLKFQLRESIKP
ncbi:MAG: hypothetical protein QF921_07820 [Pseudomonadales bacterium]|jgi:hypothetical protein|nr:hypothetical protein [Pseudomonadales bacterium]MDP6473172.1 hypothetical protein [Pseudomonadales bacterium]MDP6826071.1 hypothetical protein [Pseudomonadales bacterium]MDP6971406.1 hypothetical protein [Pseudomonadales bacterium]|tara:strand:+ start:4767 stop:5432 length:666 start_codon:yes stop_codon:yes gene_type:complete